VQQRLDKEWELTIGPDTVRLFIEKANAISAAIKDDYADGNEHEVELDGDTRDNHHHDGLAEEKADNLMAEELSELINDLNVDEAAELIALMWIGRGDYDASEWSEALAEARQRGNKRTAKYLLGMPMLGDWLEEGLEAVGA
jgi:midasin (ATPase involved in ribosome maturation)